MHILYLPQEPRANRSLVTSPARTTEIPGSLDRDALDFIERDLVAGAIIELGGARAFMRGHGLGFFQRATAGEIGGDACRAACLAVCCPASCFVAGLSSMPSARSTGAMARIANPLRGCYASARQRSISLDRNLWPGDGTFSIPEYAPRKN
jgi:hypothetical protein